MKLRYLSILLLLSLFVHYSSEQEIGYSGSNDGVVSTNTPKPANVNPIVGTIRNTTNTILRRLEGPRDRVLEFIKPAVKSDFSRNVTGVLNNIWNRLHSTNSTIIRNPLFRNTIVIPINTTLARLREITRAEDEHSELDASNLEVVNLNEPAGEAQFREYLQSSSNSSQALSNPSFIFLVRDDRENATNRNDSLVASASTEDVVTETQLSPDQPQPEQPSSVETDDEVRDSNLNDNAAIQPDRVDDVRDLPAVVQPDRVDDVRDLPAVVQPDDTLNPTKSLKRRSARFLDRNQYVVVTPTRMRHMFDNVRRHNMQDCMALALCEANCRPHRYERTRHSQFRNLFDRFDSFGSDHDDYDYYSRAREFGRGYQGNEEECDRCQSFYPCDQDREELIERMNGGY